MRNVKIPISSCFLMGIFTFCRYHLFFTGDIFDVFIINTITIIIVIFIVSRTPVHAPRRLPSTLPYAESPSTHKRLPGESGYRRSEPSRC